MKSNTKQTNRRAAFTIVELLTVMSIIVILIGLLVPALNQVKRFAYEVKQRAQFNSIDTALELFNSEFDGYPDSGAMGPDGAPYCGAMKLCEAVMGQDLQGFHPDSVFRNDGRDGTGTFLLYVADANSPLYRDSLSMRKGPYLPPENANAYWLQDLYANFGSFNGVNFVLCDVFRRVTHRVTSKKVGMPILYYRADTTKSLHTLVSDMTALDSRGNIYNYWDNQVLLSLGKPWEPPGTTKTPHRLADPARFYMNTKSEKVVTASRPYRADTYILISAGWDGEYGTPDDICNFEWKYRE